MFDTATNDKQETTNGFITSTPGKSAFDVLFGEEIRIERDIARDGYAISELPLWMFDESALKTQPRPLYRIDLGHKRYYYDFLDKMRTIARFYISVTSSIASLDLLPTSQQLIEWYSQFSSMEEAKKEMNRKADYGTFDHTTIGMYWRAGEFDLESIPELALQYKMTNNLDYDNRFWTRFAQRDLIALDAWRREHEVTPRAIELVLAGKEGFATAVDFICDMNIGTGANGKITAKDRKEGTIERITAIIDWKSLLSTTAKKTFFKTHEFQLEACKRLVEQNLPELRIDKLYNVSFEGTIRTASVTMKDQTDKANKIINAGGLEMTEFDYYWEIYKANHPNFNKPFDFDMVKGHVSGKEKAYSITTKNIKDIVIERHRRFADAG